MVVQMNFRNYRGLMISIFMFCLLLLGLLLANYNSKQDFRNESIDWFWLGVEIGCGVDSDSANKTYACLDEVVENLDYSLFVYAG